MNSSLAQQSYETDYEFLMDQLLECTADNYALYFFYNPMNELSYIERKYHLQIVIEFIYRCLKCNLLDIYASEEDLKRERIENIEHFTQLLAQLPVEKEIKDFSRLEDVIWIGFELCATENLKTIAQDCGLVAYEDNVDFSTEKGRKFRDKIEKVWADNGLPWDLEHPLFPVPLESVAITGEQREEDRETEVGQ